MANFLSVLLGPNFAEAAPAVFVLVLICCILFTYIIMKLKHIDKSLNNHITDTNKKIDMIREAIIREFNQQREDFNQKFDQQREDFNQRFIVLEEDVREIRKDIKELIKSQHASHV